MSQVSIWLGPPQRSTKMHDFAERVALPWESRLSLPNTAPGMPMLRAPSPPTMSACRRFSWKSVMRNSGVGGAKGVGGIAVGLGRDDTILNGLAGFVKVEHRGKG